MGIRPYIYLLPSGLEHHGAGESQPNIRKITPHKLRQLQRHGKHVKVALAPVARESQILYILTGRLDKL